MSPIDQDKHDKMLDRVRKLLSQAQHKNTPEAEAETFMVKAQELIAQYGFEEAELTMNDPTRAAGQVGDRVIICHAPFSPEKVGLFASVAVPMGVRCVQTWEWASGAGYRVNRADKKIRQVHAFGTQADLDRAELLYTSLLLQQVTELRKAVKRESPEEIAWHGQTAWNRSWLVGYNNRIHQRVQEAEDLANAQDMTRDDGTTVSTALVLVNKKELVDEAAAAKFPHLRKTKARKLSGSGYRSGDAAGQRANLGGDRHVNSSQARALR